MEGVYLFVLFIIGIFFVCKYKNDERKQKFDFLVKKYQSEVIAENIIARKIWIGQTAEQLYDSIGSPVNIDRKVLKTKIKEVWKYYPAGRNQYDLRIVVENDIVVVWDKKNR